MNWFTTYWFNPNTLTAFEWGNRFFLWFLLLIPVLYFFKWVFRSHKRNILNLSTNHLNLNSASYFTWLRYLMPFFFTLGLICLILAISRPQLENEELENYAEGIDIALAIDISESMLATDLSPNRLEAAKNIGLKFLEGRQHDRIALVAFAGETVSLSPLTTDYAVLKSHMKSLNTGLVATSGTALGMALSSCINKLKDVPGKSKVAILISDGDNTAGTIDPEIALELAKTFGIRVYSIAIGKDSETEKIDEKTLKMLATQSNGQFFKATDVGTLAAIFKKINLLERTKFKSEEPKNMNDYYYVYLNWALSFFLISFFFGKVLFGNILED